MKIENTSACMERMWHLLVKTKVVLKVSHKRFCPLNVLKLWHEEGLFSAKQIGGGMDEAYFEVCHLAELEGLERLPCIPLYPRKHRELIRAVIAVNCGIGMRHVNLRELDRTFSIVFPYATKINVSKKKK